MKRIEFLGDSLDRLRDLPEDVRKEAGAQLHKVQFGLEPSDWKPMASGPRRPRDTYSRRHGRLQGSIRRKVEGAIYVLHAFQKKTQKTAKHDLDLAMDRLRGI